MAHAYVINTLSQLSSIQAVSDDEAAYWKARCAAHEEEEDGRRVMGGYHGPMVSTEPVYHDEFEGMTEDEIMAYHEAEAEWEREAERAMMRYHENQAEMAWQAGGYNDIP